MSIYFFLTFRTFIPSRHFEFRMNGDSFKSTQKKHCEYRLEKVSFLRKRRGEPKKLLAPPIISPRSPFHLFQLRGEIFTVIKLLVLFWLLFHIFARQTNLITTKWIKFKLNSSESLIRDSPENYNFSTFFPFCDTKRRSLLHRLWRLFSSWNHIVLENSTWWYENEIFGIFLKTSGLFVLTSTIS